MFSNTLDSDESEMNSVGKYRGVYHSLDAVLAPLKSDKYASLPEVIDLLNIYQKSLSNLDNNNDAKKHLFIVLEGLDGAGKSTITKKLASSLQGQKMNTPPPSISHLRSKFDSHEPVLRRAYYALGNYIAANEVKNSISRYPIVMDRFWNSTTAYAIGNEIKEGKPLPPPESTLYDWPTDLLKPDFVIYLAVRESVRLQRLSRRKEFTQEENELKANVIFRNNLEETYKRMRPTIHFVDANTAPKFVVNTIKTTVLEKSPAE